MTRRTTELALPPTEKGRSVMERPVGRRYILYNERSFFT
jgi:hypothetical protein